MRVGVLGINHKLADLKLRESLARVCQRRFKPGSSLHYNNNFVLLSTCNRTEVYFSSDELAGTHSYLLGILRNEVQEISQDFDQKLYSYFGYDCFLHLCRVAAGLDSAIVAETEIQGQVKNAYESAIECCQLPHELHYLFQKSLAIAKKARGVLPVRPGMPDIEHAILQTGSYFVEANEQARILFIGASEINQKLLAFFKAKQMTSLALCNRSKEKGLQVAAKHGVSFVHWDDVASWHAYDWIILGTKSPHQLICYHDMPSYPVGHKLVIDLSVPRNVDPSLGRHPGITLLNIDQINRRLRIRHRHVRFSLSSAEELVIQSVSQHIHRFQEKENNRLRLFAVGA